MIRNVQALRAIAALLVVGVHLGNRQGFEVRYLHAAAPLLGGIVDIGYTGVDLFFVISGFIMTVTAMSRAIPMSSGQFFMLRIVRIYPVYWIISALLLFVYFREPALINAHSAFPTDLTASFLALPQRGNPLLLVGWSLAYEMYFYVVFALALSFGRRSFAPVLAIWAVATIAFNAAFGAATNPWLHLISNPICFEFLLGVAVGALVLGKRYGLPALWVGLGIAGFAAGCVVGFGSGWTRVAAAIPMALILFGAVGLEQRAKVILPQFLDRLGDASYATYLCHLPVLAILRLIVTRTPLGNASRFWDALVVVVAVTLVEAVALCMYYYLERPMTQALRRVVLPRTPAPVPRRAASPLPQHEFEPALERR